MCDAGKTEGTLRSASLDMALVPCSVFVVFVFGGRSQKEDPPISLIFHPYDIVIPTLPGLG